MIKNLISGFKKRLTIILFLISAVLVFLTGLTWQKIGKLEDVADSSIQESQNEAILNGKLPSDLAARIPPVSEDDHVQAGENTSVYLIEYSDLQCKFCKDFHKIAKKVTGAYGGRVGWVFRHYPLEDLYPDSKKVAEAAECAGEIGGEDYFWGYVSKFYDEEPEEINNATLSDVLGKIGIQNSRDFEACLDEGKYQQKIQINYIGGYNSGIRGTPQGFVINGKGDAWLIPEAIPEEQVKALIEEALR